MDFFSCKDFGKIECTFKDDIRYLLGMRYPKSSNKTLSIFFGL